MPQSWQEAIIIPISKPGKDYSALNSLITLTSCLCKTIKRMFNNRLVWILESCHKINEHQCGFRWGKSTLNHLIRMECFYKIHLSRKHAVAVFFDLKKAYDTTWRYGDSEVIYHIFISNRCFCVHIGTTLSNHIFKNKGLPYRKHYFSYSLQHQNK